MGLNKKEEEILKQIEQELMKDDPDLAKTVEDSTLSKALCGEGQCAFLEVLRKSEPEAMSEAELFRAAQPFALLFCSST